LHLAKPGENRKAKYAKRWFTRVICIGPYQKFNQSLPGQSGADRGQEGLAIRMNGRGLSAMNEPVDIRLIEGRQRAEDIRRLAAGEITPEELDRENSFIRCAAEIVHTDFSPNGTPGSWKRIIQEIERS
jgi:hypothetical protein